MLDVTPEFFWKNVSDLMKKQKIRQDEMCEAINLSIWTLRSSISKKVLPRVDVAKTIADYLNTSVDFLLTGKEENIYKAKYENLKKEIEALLNKV